MNKQYLFLLMTLIVTSLNARYVVDKVVAVVYGEGEDDIAIVTLSNITRPGIDGVVHSLDDRVFEKLLWFDGKKHRILPTEEDIERHLKVVERENNIGRKELIEIFRNGGYTFEEGKEQFGIMYTVNAMIDFKVRGGLFVSQKEVQAYYNDNPEYIDATYILQRGIIQYNYALSEAEQVYAIKQAIAAKKEIVGITWSPAFSIKQDQIAADKRYIIQMKSGDISDPLPTNEGIEVFKVIDVTARRLCTLDERYLQIAELLRRPKYQEILTSYKLQLYDHASIVYF